MNEDRPRPARLLLALLLALPLYAGCQGFDTPFAGRDPGGYDPLVNGPPIPSGDAAPKPQPVASNTNTNAGAPKNNPPPGQPAVLPGQPTGASPAALAASGTRPTTTAAADERAKGPPGTTDGAGGWRNAGGGAPGGATLHGAEPISDTVHAPGPGAGTTGVTPAGGVPRVETLEQAFDVLKKTYGMSWSKLTQVSNSDEYQFECAIPHRTAANMSQYYDGHGTGALGAVRNVLDKVIQEQGGN
jgi:hypothetical protein